MNEVDLQRLRVLRQQEIQKYTDGKATIDVVQTYDLLAVSQTATLLTLERTLYSSTGKKNTATTTTTTTTTTMTTSTS
jgi:hypothetical protein